MAGKAPTEAQVRAMFEATDTARLEREEREERRARRSGWGHICRATRHFEYVFTDRCPHCDRPRHAADRIREEAASG